VTVKLATPEIEPEVAVIVTGAPAATPLASPTVETAAVPGALEVHTTADVRSWVVALVKVPMAVSCWVVPAAMLFVAGVT
jgi:hypothetical protein